MSPEGDSFEFGCLCQFGEELDDKDLIDNFPIPFSWLLIPK
jgi:hypothetical protein